MARTKKGSGIAFAKARGGGKKVTCKNDKKAAQGRMKGEWDEERSDSKVDICVQGDHENGVDSSYDDSDKENVASVGINDDIKSNLDASSAKHNYHQNNKSSKLQLDQDGQEKIATQLEINEESNEYFSVRQAGPGRGLGVFAKKHLKQGTRILAEEPLLIVELKGFSSGSVKNALEVSSDQYIFDIDVTEKGANKAGEVDYEKGSEEKKDVNEEVRKVRRVIWGAFEKLGEIDRRRVLALHSPLGKSGNWKVDCLRVLGANGFDFGVGGAAVCVRAARFNHSCVPNTHFAWNSNLHKQTFHIISPSGVPPGTELTVCYDSPTSFLKTRQAHLLSTYNFTCTCPVCDLTTSAGKASLRRRKQISDLMDKLKLWDEFPNEATVMTGTRDPVELCRRMRVLLMEEGVVGLALARVLRKEGKWLLQRGMLGKARKVAGEELKVVTFAVGVDSPRVEEVRAWIEGLK